MTNFRIEIGEVIKGTWLVKYEESVEADNALDARREALKRSRSMWIERGDWLRVVGPEGEVARWKLGQA